MRTSTLFCCLLFLFGYSGMAQTTSNNYRSSYLNNYIQGKEDPPTSLVILKNQNLQAPELQLDQGPSIKINKYHVFLYNAILGEPVNLNLTIPQTPHEEILDIRNANMVHKLPNQFGIPRSGRNSIGNFFLNAIF